MAKFDSYYWHFDMLRDDKRNIAYDRAVAHALSTRPESLAFDIGTGSGLLALLCLKHGCEEVHALEVVPELARIASLNAAANGYSERMTVINKHSTDLSPTRANIPRPRLVVAELLDTGLIGEGLLPSMRHAVHNLLSDDVVSIPSSGTVFAQLVEGALVSQLRSLIPAQDSLLQFPRSCAVCSGAASPLHVHAAPLLQRGLLKPLTEAVPMLQFEFCKPPPPQGRVMEYPMPISSTGRVDGVLVWWECAMGPGVPMLSTAPGLTGPPDHWRQALFSLGPQQGGGTVVHASEEVTVTAAHDDHMLWFQMGPRRASSGTPPLCSCRAHALLSPQRFWHINNAQSLLEVAARTAAAAAQSNGGVVAVIADDPVLALLVMKAGGRVAMDEGGSSVEIWQNWFEANELQIGAIEDLNLPTVQIGAVLGEPTFAEASALCSMAVFWGEVDRIKPRFVESCRVLPSRCTVRAALVDCEGLWMPHQRVSQIEGVQMAAINELLAGSSVAREVNMWEYEHTQMSEVVTLFEIDAWDFGEVIDFVGEIVIQTAGTVHMLCVWVENEVALTPIDLAEPQPRSQEAAVFESCLSCSVGDKLVLSVTLQDNGELGATCVAQPDSSNFKKQKFSDGVH